MLARFLFWRLLGLLAGLAVAALAVWLLSGGLGTLLRGAHRPTASLSWGAVASAPGAALRWGWDARVGSGPPIARLVVATCGAVCAALAAARWSARRWRRYGRHRIVAHRIDRAEPDALLAMFDGLHKRLLQRWWRRLLAGQPSLSLEVHLAGEEAWLAVSCPLGSESLIESALQTAYPNLHLARPSAQLDSPPCLLRLKKRSRFIEPLRVADPREPLEPPTNRLLTVMGAMATDAVVQLSLTPAPPLFERWARRRFLAQKRRSQRSAACPATSGGGRRSSSSSCARRSTFSTARCSSPTCA